MPAAAVTPAELEMGNFVAVETFVVTITLFGDISSSIDGFILSATKLERYIRKVDIIAW